MRTAAFFALAALAGCATPAAVDSPKDRFFNRLASLCGKAFEGRIASPPVEADAAFAGKRLVMHVRSCTHSEIRIPFHVGEDRSRIWVVSRAATGLRLKHEHRTRDGTEEARSRYGGDTVSTGSARRQEFPADRFSRNLFARENIPASAANVWAVEIAPGRSFAYALDRDGRHFRVEFDLTRRVPPPPPAWGAR